MEPQLLVVFLPPGAAAGAVVGLERSSAETTSVVSMTEGRDFMESEGNLWTKQASTNTGW